MSDEEFVGGPVLSGIIGLIVFGVSALILRWVFSIGGMVKLLEQIRDELKKLNTKES